MHIVCRFSEVFLKDFGKCFSRIFPGFFKTFSDTCLSEHRVMSVSPKKNRFWEPAVYLKKKIRGSYLIIFLHNRNEKRKR